jgi:hypothetical protein
MKRDAVHWEQPTVHERAMSRLQTPALLLTAAGLLTALTGVVLFIMGLWPLAFAPAPPPAPIVIESMILMGLGGCIFFWGAIICYGADRMKNLSSYRLSLVASVLAIVPFLVGLYALSVLSKPDTIAEFARACE